MSGFSSTVPLALLPGWAFDGRPFEQVAWPCPTMSAPTDSADAALAALDRWADAAPGGKIDLFGWSWGAHLALRFRRRRPQAVGRVTLAGLRLRFSAEEITAQQAWLRRDPPAMLHDFYRRALLGHRDARRWWNPDVEAPRWADRAEALSAGLDDLAAGDVQPTELADVLLVHGLRDVVAPWAELSAAASTTERRDLLFPQAGHLPFLHPDFPERFRQAWNL